VTWFLPMKKGFLGGIPKFEACTSWIFIGVHGHPQAWAFVHSSTHLIILQSLHLKTSIIQNQHNSISNISVSIIMNQPPFCFVFQLKITTDIAYTTVATSPKVPWSKELKKKAIERETQIVAEICQNRTAEKGQFFRGFYGSQIKKCITNESLDITWDICTRNLRSNRYSENFHEFLRCSTEICFRTAISPNLTSRKLEISFGTKTK
jgi:hypothetical protein